MGNCGNGELEVISTEYERKEGSKLGKLIHEVEMI